MKAKRLPTAERRLQIAEAALHIIATTGVHGLTAMALANRVGIADGTIFRHFKHKQEIVDAAIDLFEARLAGSFPDLGGEPLERLGAFIVKRLTLVRKTPALVRLAFNDRLAEAAGKRGAERVQKLVAQSLKFVHDCLEEAQAKGQIATATPTMLLVWMVTGVVQGVSSNASQHMTQGQALATTPATEIWANMERVLRDSVEEPQ